MKQEKRYLILYFILIFKKQNNKHEKWRPPSLSELTPMVFNTGLTHLGSEASISQEKQVFIDIAMF